MLRVLVLLAMISLGVVGAAQADPRDFSTGLTGVSENPTVKAASGGDAEWQARQKATEAQAKAALTDKPASSGAVAAGQLAAGNKIKLTVFGEEDLSGEFEIDNTGSLSMPLVGEIPAAGLTPRQLEQKIAKTLENGYLVNPRISVEVLNFRPFFILGEVNKPGSYPYVNDLTVINAVAMGGGYTPRAKTGQVKIRRMNDPEGKESWVGEEEKVFPGDVIRVDERFF